MEEGGEGRLDAQSVSEADFPFGWMNIDIHGGWIHFHEKKAQWILAAGEGISVSGPQGVGQRWIFHGPTIDENQT